MSASGLKDFVENIENVGELLHVSPYDSGRKVFKYQDCVYKIVKLSDSLSPQQRMNKLKEEYEILVHLKNTKGLSDNPRYQNCDDYECLSYQYIDGHSLDKSINEIGLTFKLGFDLWLILARISLKGVAHRDIRLNNFILDNQCQLYLIDFDQAIITSVSQAIALNYWGNSYSTPMVYGSFSTIIKLFNNKKINLVNKIMNKVQIYTSRLANAIFPASVKDHCKAYIRGKVGASNDMQESPHTMPPNLADSASDKLNYLRKAWLIARDSNANSPGVPIAYYSLSEQGYYFPGERPWLERWKYLSNATQYKDKNIIELGCNMGLLSSYLLKDKAAKQVLAVDIDYEILSAAQLVAAAHDVSPYFRKIDFDAQTDWDEELKSFGADILFALNVLNWVSNKDRFKKFLFSFNEVIFEGHDSIDVERAMFEDQGYEVSLLSVSERGRSVIRAVRSK